MSDTVLLKAKFDPKVKLYWYFQGLWMHFILIFTGIGFFTFPLWAVFGLLVVSKRYDAMSAEMTERSVHLRMGVLTKVEKTVPLDKIQDLSLRTGPILNMFGLASLQVETAGSAAPGADMVLPGLSNAKEFRDGVLERRDMLTENPKGQISAPAETLTPVMEEIRDTLQRIEALLAAQNQA